MRMWNVPTQLLCNQHLLGEHVEMHMFAGALRAGRSVKGHVDKGQVEVHNIEKRHEELAQEMQRRGFHHASPLHYGPAEVLGQVSVTENLQELQRRCSNCRHRQQLSGASRLLKGETV